MLGYSVFNSIQDSFFPILLVFCGFKLNEILADSGLKLLRAELTCSKYLLLIMDLQHIGMSLVVMRIVYTRVVSQKDGSLGFQRLESS